MVWPEGKENWSGGSRVAQQCGSNVKGRLRLVVFFKVRKIAIPKAAAKAAADTAWKRAGPPKSRMTAPMPYHSQPSPPRVAHSAQRRIQLGAGQRLTRRISRWSRCAM